jgi:phenylpropionate dioxygenase-like ring-hydroxylating dioxygenase large terminal subunit
MPEAVSVQNAWYAVAVARMVVDSPVQRWLFGTPIVLFRDSMGSISALVDICPHRNAPLSLGRVVGDRLQCRYHGFEFERSGRCAAIPNQASAPAALTVRALPTIERYGIIWVWPGDSTEADPTQMVDWPWYDDPAFQSLHLEFTLDAPVEMALDNLMDLTHVHFVHAFGANLPVHNSAPMKVSTENDAVRYTRDVIGAKFLSDRGEESEAPTYMEIGGAFFPPAVVQTSGLTKSSATREIAEGPHRIILHGLTPERADRTHYVYMRSWNIYLSPDDVAAAITEDEGALLEDKDIIEATWRHKNSIGGAAGDRLVGIDEAAVKARRRYAAFEGTALPQVLR